MFKSLTLRGSDADISLGYRQAAAVIAWKVIKGKDGSWRLVAKCRHWDAFQLKQKSLIFSAPRPVEGGRWCFDIRTVTIVGPGMLTATLAPPVQ